MTWQIDLILFCLTKEDKVLAQMIFLFFDQLSNILFPCSFKDYIFL